MSKLAPTEKVKTIWSHPDSSAGRHVKPMVPKVTPTDQPTHESVETHPAYGSIGASRVSGRSRLFGSDFDHQHFVTLRIKRAEMMRGLNRDWMSSKEELIEVALSEAQWATMIATPNTGEGVPCTIQYIRVQKPEDDDIVGSMPDILEPPQTRREQFGGEVRERMEKALKALADLEERIKAGKGGKDSLSLLNHARSEITGNLEFTAEQFDRHMEKTVERAKIEIAAYQGRIFPALAQREDKALPEENA